MTLLVVERSGDYTKVQTFDGKQGWIESKRVK